MTICSVTGKNCEWNSPGPIGTIAKPCPKAKGAIWVHVLDDLGKNIPEVHTHKDDGSQQSTDPNGLSTYDPLDPNAYKVSLPPLSKTLLDDYYPPDTDHYNGVSVSDGQITYVAFQLKRRMNNVTPEMTVDKQEVQPPFPDQSTIDKEIHHFQPEKKAAADTPQVVAVTLTYKETLPKYAYDKGGVFTVSGVTATLWKDDKCKDPLDAPGGTLNVANGELKSGYKFYMRGDSAGTATLSLTLEDTSKDRVIVDTNAITKDVTVKAVNRVTPFLKVEHLVVLRDRELCKKQRKNDSAAGSAAADADQQIHPDPTRIELSAKKTADAPEYKGKGKLVLTPANVKLFTDEKCEADKEFDPSKEIDFDKLTAGSGVILYMRGITAGKFTAELKLDPSNDGLIKVDDPAKGELGCVELKAKLFHFKEATVNKAVEPDVDDVTTFWDQMKGLDLQQEEMTDDERVGTGRLIHVKRDKHCARAKLIVERTKAEWPDAAKDYKIVLNTADADKKNKTQSGGLKLFDKDVDGTEIALPQKLSLTDFDKKDPVWAEGATKCDKWRDIRLSAGFERPDGGPAWATKLDGDWGTFTVINIKEVKCDVDNVGGQEKFVDGDKIFINLDANGRLLKTVGGNRKAEVTAEIEPKLKDVDIYFCIVEEKGNFAITTFPDDFKEKKIAKLKHELKPVDKDDRKKLLHMKVQTDDQGKAKIEKLQTPQAGLLKFKVGTYILADPEQARFVDGSSEVALQKSPVLSSTWLVVWRRLFFKVVAMERWSGASYMDRFNEGDLRTQMEDRGIEFERVGAPVERPYVRALPNFLTWARGALGGTAGPRTQYLCLINGRGDKADVNKGPYNLGAPSAPQLSYNLPYIRFRSIDPGNRAQWLDNCTLTHNGNTYDLANATTVTQTEDFKFDLEIDYSNVVQDYGQTVYNDRISAGDSDPDAQNAGMVAINDIVTNGSVSITFKEADFIVRGKLVRGRGGLHGLARARPRDAGCRVIRHAYLPARDRPLPRPCRQVPTGYRQYAQSELLFRARRRGERARQGRQRQLGLGPHCDGLSDDCIMWFQFKMTLAYCEMCSMMLRTRAYHTPAIQGRAQF